MFTWPCAPVLAQYLFYHQDQINGKKVLEVNYPKSFIYEIDKLSLCFGQKRFRISFLKRIFRVPGGIRTQNLLLTVHTLEPPSYLAKRWDALNGLQNQVTTKLMSSLGDCSDRVNSWKSLICCLIVHVFFVLFIV